MPSAKKHELTPQQVAALNECQGHCSRALPILEYLRDVGVPDEEGERRHQYLSQLAERMLGQHQANVSHNRRR